jgi:hypothetical protein
MKRWPRGYVGTNHETIGSSLLSVLQVLTLPDQVLGAEEVRRLQEVNPKQWYRVDWLLSLMDRLDRVAGHYGLMSMGRRRFELSHKKRLPIRSARDIVYGIDNMYRFANRGQDIGGWKVLKFEPGFAELEKTTPHHCRMEQGLLAAALAEAKCPGIISQTQCFRQGADSCIYTISSAFTDVHWSGD